MTTEYTPYRFKIYEDSGASLMARVLMTDASAMQQADISSVAYTIYDLADTSTAASSGTLTIADVIFDTLQTDARWSTDSTGYNFRWDVPASVFAAGSKTYRIEIAFTPVTGEVFHVIFEGETRSLYRS